MTAGYYFHIHNMLINRLIQLGYPGAFIFVILFFGLPWVLWLRRRQSDNANWLASAGIVIAAGVFAKNMTDDFFMRELGYFYWVLGGALLGIQQASKSGMKTDRFLIIRRDNIGDLLCTTPLMRALRQRYPAAQIDALVNSYNAPVLANNPDLNHIYAYTKAKHRAAGETVLGVYWQRIKLMWQLRQMRYDVVILAGDGNLDRQLGLARWLKAGQVIGFAPDDGKPRNGLDIAVPKREHGHEVERTFSLLAPLGITGEPPKMVLVPSTQDVERARRRIPVLLDTPTIAIHISARKIPQRWPIERFAELMHAVHEKAGARFVLLWSPGDENNPLHPGDDQKAAALLALVDGLPVVAYPTHQLSELIAALSLCGQMVCSDGGAMHIGAALGLPIVAMFGNSEGERWRPWGGDFCLMQKPSRDVKDIQANEVSRTLLRL